MAERIKWALLVLASALFWPSHLWAAELDPTYSLKNKFGISVVVDPEAGRYSVNYNGQSWFGPGIVSVLVNRRWYRSAEIKFPEAVGYEVPQGRLVLEKVSPGSGEDGLGGYDSIDVGWSVPDTEVSLITGFRLYRDKPYLVFLQQFPKGFKNYATGNWILPSVSFPQFITGFGERNDLYSWTSGGMFTHRFSYGAASSLGGTVDLLVLADKNYHTVVLSPFANYLVATQQSTPVATRNDTNPNKSAISCGIEGLVDEIPGGFEHANILVIGQGIHSTFERWGQALLTKAGKKIPSKYWGDNLKYPTYWDDYGSYYREHGFKEEGYKTYEDIILGVAEDANEHGLRIGAYQVQDLDQLRYQEGLFEPREDLFPHGLKWLHEKLGASLEAYIAWLPPNGPYRERYPYFKTTKGSAPFNSMGDVFYSEEYWRDTAEKLASWGVTLLQHDFLSVYEGDKEMMAGTNRMDTYFKNMAKALQEKGMTMQYCMQLPRNIMQSTENPMIISAQGSWDHHVDMAEPHKKERDDDSYVWKHLIFTSAFYGAVGIWPSRDNIQTVADPNAFEDVLLANLLGGEIQLGHRIGECNFDLVKKTYREGDGLILKADRPIAPLDRCYLEGCAMGYTESERDGRKWFYVLSLPGAGYLRAFSVSDLGVSGKWAVYNFDTQLVSIEDASTLINLQREAKHEYFIVAPILENGMALIGDTEKFVSMAETRIESVEATGDWVRVGVISDQAWNPLIVGYAPRRPAGAEVGGKELEEVSSLDRLQRGKSGWFWDYQSKLWWVKVDFNDAQDMETRWFRIH